MSGECDKCGEHCLDCLCKEYVTLIPFKEDRMICPECSRIFPKLRLPLLTVCPSCPDENIRQQNREFEERLKNAKPKSVTPPSGHCRECKNESVAGVCA